MADAVWRRCTADGLQRPDTRRDRLLLLLTHLMTDKTPLDQPPRAQRSDLCHGQAWNPAQGAWADFKEITKLVKRQIFNLVFPFYTKSLIQVTNCIYSQTSIKQSKLYISLYTDLINKFYLDKRTCATTVLNSMIKDCSTPKSVRYVQMGRKRCTSGLIMIQLKTPDPQYTC